MTKTDKMLRKFIKGIFVYLNYTYNRNQSERQGHQQPELQRNRTDEIKKHRKTS